MATVVVMPKLGLEMRKGVIAQWLVKEGDALKKGDAFFEVETDKLSQDVECDYDGTVLKLLVSEGTTVDCGTNIMILGEPDEDITGIF